MKILSFCATILLKILIYGFPSLYAITIIIIINPMGLKPLFFVGWVLTQVVWVEAGRAIDHWIFSLSAKQIKQEEKSE